MPNRSKVSFKITFGGRSSQTVFRDYLHSAASEVKKTLSTFTFKLNLTSGKVSFKIAFGGRSPQTVFRNYLHSAASEVNK